MIGLNLFTLVVSAFASYRLTRLILVDSIFDFPRDRVLRWLRRGETKRQRRVGRFTIQVGAFAAFIVTLGWVCGLITDDPMYPNNSQLAMRLMYSFGIVVAGAVTGYRDYLEELLTCPWCVGVWTAAGVTALLSVWGHWPVIPTIVFTFAVAGGQCFLNMGEELIETAIVTGTGTEDAHTETAVKH